MKTRVLITGVAGFIGSHVAQICIREGWSVTGIDDLSGGFIANVPKSVNFVKGSVTDKKFVNSLFHGTTYDYVYHLAAYAAEGLSHFIRHFNYQNNLLGSMLLINQSVLHSIKCFVFTSSIAVYGSGQTPMTEEMTPKPEDPYGISKYAVELDLAAAHRLFGLDYIIFRPHNVYGERQNIGDRYRNVIGIFMNQVIQGKPLTIFGDGLQTRAFTYIDDVAPLIAKAPLFHIALNQTFNIGSDKPYTVRYVAEKVSEAFGAKPVFTYLNPRQEVVHAFASHAKIREIFWPTDSVSLVTGINNMATWAKTHASTKSKSFKNIEVPINLPTTWKI